MSESSRSEAPASLRSWALNYQIASIVSFGFICYLTIGIPLAVIPGYVDTRLGFGSFLAGLAISTQYVATFLSRARAGRMCDFSGPKRTVCLGLAVAGVSGVLLVLSAQTARMPGLSLFFLLFSRLFLGVGESFVGTGVIIWGIGRVGVANTARIISWSGVAAYGGIAVGAPLGVFLDKSFGFSSIGLSVVALAWLSVPLAMGKPGTVTTPGGKPIPILRVFGRVFPYGLGLALGSIGFASIATFVTLFYASHGWSRAAFTLSAFGTVFIGVRLLLGESINRFGGHYVALVCFLVESIGLGVLGTASSPGSALLGAVLTALGFSLVFPSLGVEAVARVTADNRGAALAVYSVFIDLALGITGPVGGLLAAHFTFGSVYLFAALCSGAGLLLTVFLLARR